MRKQVLVSDQSGDVIEDGKHATLKIQFNDARTGNFEADLSADEATAIVKAAKARKVVKRGRKPAATPAPAA